MAYDFAKLNVLVVEDNQYMRSLLKEVLRSVGVRADHLCQASDGTEALDLLKSFPADLVITDWQMEPMDGLTFTRKIRTDEHSPNPFIPIILCTGHTERHKIEIARDSGVNEILGKPIDARTLYARIRSIVENPRPFTKSDEYVGPDRRRRSDSDFEAKRNDDGTAPDEAAAESPADDAEPAEETAGE